MEFPREGPLILNGNIKLKFCRSFCRSVCSPKARERSGRSGCNFVGVLGGVPERFRKKNSSDPTTIKNFNLFSMKSRFHLSSANYIFFGFKISDVCRNLIVAGTKKNFNFKS